jgi:hypothetical protein
LLIKKQRDRFFSTWALITRDANEVGARFITARQSFRMPLYIPQAMAEEWISPDLSLKRYREILLTKCPLGI